MSDRTKIEWTDATWNPIRARDRKTGKVGWGCVKVSPACDHCYAAAMNRRLGTGLPYVASADVEYFLDLKVLMKPLRWKTPRMIFPCSMTDLFGPWVSDEWILRIYDVMEEAHWHTFQVLTKRAQRLLDFHVGRSGAGFDAPSVRNVWLGVTAENRRLWNERVALLCETPAAFRWVSAEPWVDDSPDFFLSVGFDSRWTCTCFAPAGQEHASHCVFHRHTTAEICSVMSVEDRQTIDQVVLGGESGQQARWLSPYVARSFRDICVGTHVPFFFKQWGEWLPSNQFSREQLGILAGPKLQRYEVREGETLYRVGKKFAGRLLDGREWNEFPSPTLEAV